MTIWFGRSDARAKEGEPSPSMGEGWVGWSCRSITTETRGIRSLEASLSADKRMIRLCSRVAKSMKLVCREPLRLRGHHPHPSLPHQGGGLYYRVICKAICEALH